MAKTHVLIVEDESIVAKDLELSLRKLGFAITGVTDNADKAYSLALKKRPDIILMDIILKNGDSGIEVAKRIKEEIPVPIVYLTANADPETVELAKSTEPHGYIVKPFKEIDLQTTIDMATYKFKKELERQEEMENGLKLAHTAGGHNKRVFMVKNKSTFIKLDPEDILYVEALKDYVVVNTKDTRYTIHSTMKEIEKKMPTDIYARVHRSYIVQIDAIEKIEYHMITLKGVKKEIPVGGSYREPLKNTLNYL